MLCYNSCDLNPYPDVCEKSPYVNQVASGTFMNEPFTFTGGIAKVSQVNAPHHSFSLYGEDIIGDICDHIPKKIIRFDIPNRVGTTIFDLTSLYFINSSNPDSSFHNLVLCGEVEILEVNENTVKGRITAFNDQFITNSINGNFEVTLCD